MKKILQILSGHPSYDHIRIIKPLQQINEQLKAYNIAVSLIPIDKLDEHITQQFDVICMHGCGSLGVYNILRKNKFCLWVDDLMTDIPIGNPARAGVAELEGLRWAYQSAQNIVCTTKYLSDHLWENYKVKSFICPNLINIEHKENKSENVLYSFGNSHTNDLELLKRLRTHRNVYFFGHTLPSTFCHYYRNPFGGVELYPNRKNVFWVPLQVDYEKYQIYMTNLDYGVGLIPLQDNNFNKAKSILKVGEYISNGAISVVSNIGALREIPNECVVKVLDGNWKNAIEDAFHNRANLYKSCYSWWMDNYSYYSQAQKWLTAYREM